MMPHVLRAQQFDRELLEVIFRRADTFRQIKPSPNDSFIFNPLGHKLMFNLFYEPSTRTRFSFEVAAHRLGIHIVSTENAREFSSAVKGETLEDTIRVLSEYAPDVIVLRHQEEGAAERAARITSIPIINAGDGKGQHPTQAVLDVYTIHRELKTIDGLTVLIGGDLKYGRTARSLAYLLSKFKSVRLIFISPPQLRMEDDVLQHLREHNTPFEECDTLADGVKQADVVYWTRIQKERADEDTSYEDITRKFCITAETLTTMKPSAIIMHPLPRNDEIDQVVDGDLRAAYFRQAGNGVPIRMALLEWALTESY